MVNYVKFVRGTLEQWKNFTNKNDDTLYFISDLDGSVDLYLGSKLIAGSEQEIGSLSIDALLDVIITNAQADQLLIYDADQHAWVNKSLEEGLSTFIGATSGSNGKAGLVPAPEIGKTDLFLKSDGTWADPTVSTWVISHNNDTHLSHGEIIASLSASHTAAAGDIIIIKDPLGSEYKYSSYVYNGTTWLPMTGAVDANDVYVENQTLTTVLSSLVLSGDDQTIVVNDNTLSLKNYGLKYYAYDADNEEYIEQLVDEAHPWKAGLEPRVTSEDGQLVIGWYEQNTATVDGINSTIGTLQTSVSDLQNRLTPVEAALADKANAADVYTKTETQEYVAAQVAGLSHLKRIKVEKLEDIDPTAENAEQYIYMVPTGLTEDDNKYYEYMVIDGIVEPVGTWEVDLSEYAKASQVTELATALNGKVDKVDGSRLLTEAEGTKLANIADGAEVNIINAIDSNYFELNDTRRLTLKDLSVSKVANLSTILNNKVDKEEGSRLITADEINKLNGIEAGAQKNYIAGTSAEFKVENGILSLISISSSAISDLENVLKDKANASDLVTLQNTVVGLQGQVNAIQENITWGTLA